MREKDKKLAEVIKKHKHLIQTLGGDEKTVITERFGIYDGKMKYLKDVGKKLGITHQRVHQIQSNAISRMCQYSKMYGLKG